MTDRHNIDENTQNMQKDMNPDTPQTPSLPSTAGRSARERSMLVNHDAKVWGEVVEGEGGGFEVVNPVKVKRAMSAGERSRRAIALKLSGASYRSIADTLGFYDQSSARKAVMRGMSQSLQEDAGELRKLHYGRLEHVLGLLWPDVNARDLPTITVALGVMDRMAKLYGLDAPDRHAFEVGGKETVFVADGDKASYLKALQEAGAEVVGGEVASDDEEE